MKISVYRMSGAGNLFSVIDNRKYNFSIEQLKNISPILCKVNAHNNFEAEGLIAINFSEHLDFSAEFLNPDGSHGAMCGNGGRCAVQIAKHLNLINKSSNILFKMAGDEFSAEITEKSLISLNFPPPKEIKQNIVIEYDNRKLNVDYVDVGSQHIVIDFSDLLISTGFREFDINLIGKILRSHPAFMPKGVNVNIYQIQDSMIQLRTYERGVEAETGACGTGSISTAIICSAKHGLEFPIVLIPPSRQKLSVDCKFNSDGSIDSVFLIGPAEILVQHEIVLPYIHKEQNG